MTATALFRLTRITRSFLLAGLMITALPQAGAQQPPGGPQQADMTIGAAQRNALIGDIIAELNKSYVFPEQAKKAEAALREHQKRGAYDAITSAEKLKETLSEHLYAVTSDKHLKVFYSAKPIPEQSKDRTLPPEQKAMQLAFMRAQNFGVEKIQRLPFNIGYLELHGFAPSEDAAQTIAAAMTVLANTDTLIIDLRKNGGGDPKTVTMLASYLLDQRTHLSDIYYRQGDRTEQMWSDDKVSGQRYGQKKDVYILTSKHTFSAAEDFSYALKNLKRATVVGETTGGGAHPGDFTRLTTNFAMFVPNGRSISPLTKTDWEGVGVVPDVAVKAEDAMKTAQVAALNKLLAGEKDPAKMGRLNARIAAVQAEDTSQSMAR